MPLTAEGKIIVDGVLTSCYADIDHDVVHSTMAPMKRFSDALEWLFGNDNGFPIYVYIARELGILLLPDGHNWTY